MIRTFLENLNTLRERTAASNGSSPETVVFPAVNKILLFQLVVENPEALQNANARAGKRQRSFQFTFGFALIHATDEADELLYFRVQDHLLKMGLARKAMKAMLEKSAQERRQGKKRTVRLNAEPLREMLRAKAAQRVLRKDLVPARELTGEKGLEWFRQLFESVQLELGAKYDR